MSSLMKLTNVRRQFLELKHFEKENDRLQSEIAGLMREIEVLLGLPPTTSIEDGVCRIQELLHSDIGSFLLSEIRKAGEKGEGP
mmetsp:Transcript_10213/g.20602  ORF Transcript_10213/g.20602 Transcript_10213/m.20602 type:complete len:84 (+) Transcript_10213:632-883(+)